jgi:magnesium-transporting ATPase (P-type)
VLLDDDFATVVAAIREGRSTYANIRRFFTYHLTDNVAELTPFVLWAASGGRLPLALGVLQILCLDIGVDIVPALALGAEPPRTERSRPDVEHHLLDRSVLVRVFGVLGPVEAIVEVLAFLTVFWSAGWRPGSTFPAGHVLLRASGAAFAAVVFGQIACAFACRSASRPPWALGWRTNRLLVGAVVLSCVTLAALLGIGPVARQLHHTFPGAVGLAVAVGAAPAVLLADTAAKAARRRRSWR